MDNKKAPEENKMFKYIYEIYPIDFFLGTYTFEELFRQTVEEDFEFISLDVEHKMQFTEELIKDWREKEAFIQGYLRHEKLREEIRAFFVPSSSQMQIGYIAKIDNNGTTYIFSQVELPHLNELALDWR